MRNTTMIVGVMMGMFIPSISFAAAQVQVKPGEITFNSSYTFSKNEESYHEVGWGEKRNINGHAREYGITFGLKNGYAVSVGMNNYRFDQFDDGHNQQTTPSLDTVDLNIQKRLTDNFALFTGLKHVTGNWTYNSSAYTPSSITCDNSSRNVAEIGFIAQKNLSDKVRAYGMAGAGYHLREYKVGLAYDNLDIGYRYVKYQSVYNPLFATASPVINGLDLTVKGFYFSLNHRL